MISVTTDSDGEIIIVQRELSPTVYLDNWALGTIAKDSKRASRLISSIRRRGGTLALSWLNIAEFARVPDDSHRITIEHLVEDLLPQIVFIQVDFGEVIERENMLLAGTSRSAPHIDADLAKFLLYAEPKHIKPLSARELFARAAQPEVVHAYNKFLDRVLRGIDKWRSISSARTSIGSVVKQYVPGNLPQRLTRIIRDILFVTLRDDKRLKIERNDVADILHSVVPLAYCDYVLLDKHWRDKARRVGDALPPTVPLARCYSQMVGVDRLLQELDNT